MSGVYFGDVGSTLDDAAQISQLVADILDQERQPGGILDPSTPSTFNVMELKTPIESYLFARRNPVAAYAVPAILFMAAFLVGRSVGESKRR